MFLASRPFGQIGLFPLGDESLMGHARKPLGGLVIGELTWDVLLDRALPDDSMQLRGICLDP